MSASITEPIQISDGVWQIGDNAIITKEGFKRCCAPEVNVNDKRAIIKSVKDVAEGLGYSSYAMPGRDDFDHMRDADSTYTNVIQGGLSVGFQYPYDVIQHRLENEWLIRCTNIYFRIYYNIIPYHDNFDCYDCNFRSDNLGIEPNIASKKKKRIFMVPRSSGPPSEAILENSQGIKFHNPTHTSVETSVDNLLPYMISSFNADGNPIDLSMLYAPTLSHKCVLIDDVAANNPSFESLNIKFTLFSDSEIGEATSETQKEVMRYFNEFHKDWFQNICAPVLKKISNINIKVFEKKGDENTLVFG